MKRLSIIICFFLCLSARVTKAQYNILLNFNDTNGRIPQSPLLLSGDTLYGMTDNGGTWDYGLIFKIDTDGNVYKDLFDFDGGINGSSSSGNLILAGKTLYGMSNSGGLWTYGLVFKINTNGSGHKVLMDFNDTNGGYPGGSLTIFGKAMYGMTSYGGANNKGVVFKLDTDGNVYKKLLDFNGTNGNTPWGGLTLSGNTLFGMTEMGGVHDSGCIFSIDTDGSGYKKLLDFNGANGKYPYGDLTLYGKTLYGMTFYGGTNRDGVVFKIDTDGNGYKDLMNFNGINGKGPAGDSLTLSGKTLYGMTHEGGIYSNGVIFSIDTNGSGYKKLLDFNGANGKFSYGGLTLSGKSLYGMTEEGGTNNDGVIFKIDTDAVAGINELRTESEEVRVFPNPNNGVFQLVISNEQLVIKNTVEIYNMLGERVYSNSYQPIAISHQLITIDLSDKPAGIYLYRVITETGEQIGTGKFIIQK